MAGDMDDLVKDFLVESYENLEKLDQAFVELERNPGDRERLGAIFRVVHTLKGVSGFLDFNKLQALTHSGENLLSKLRDGVLILDDAITDGLLALVDAIRQILTSVEATQKEGDGNYVPLAARLDALANGENAAPVRPAVTPSTESIPTTSTIRAQTVEFSPTADPGPVTETMSSQSQATAVTSIQNGRGAHAGGPPTAVQTGAVAAPAHGESVADQSVRVDVSTLDRLVNLVGELVLTRNRLMLHPASATDSGLQSLAQALNHLTTELQQGIMKTRMQPIGTLWSKLPRVVRDLSRSLGKQIRMEMDGQDTELDRTLIEALKDPMTHIVRNACDHGVESPEQRLKEGKNPEGVLGLSACHRSGHVVISVTDDGKGIDPKRITAKAVEKGLLTADQAARITPQEAVNLVFLPGFSTVEKISNVSGRGVGMDVVKTNIERIGGRVDLVSTPGLGTVLTLTIPLTLAIVPALIVTSGLAHFAIPQTMLVELVRTDADKVETVFDAPVIRLRGHLLPLAFLNQVIGRDVGKPQSVNILVLQANERRFGLVVDAIHNTEEIVVKPLSGHFTEIPLYAGATILGDGRLAMILDVLGLARMAELSDRGGSGRSDAAVVASDTVAMLVFISPDDGRMAIPLANVTRLEELDATKVERLGEREVIQYRGNILPLVRVFAHLPERRKEPRNPDSGVPAGLLQVVVYSHRGASGEARQVGLVVGAIIDTVEVPAKLERTASRAGIVGCTVIQGKVTEVLDAAFVIERDFPDLARAAATSEAEAEA